MLSYTVYIDPMDCNLSDISGHIVTKIRNQEVFGSISKNYKQVFINENLYFNNAYSCI